MEIMSAEDRQKIIDKIHELLGMLPTDEQYDYETLLLAMEVREDLSNILQRKDTTEKDVISELERARKKKEALDDLISMNKVFKDLYSALKGQAHEDLTRQGAAMRKVIKKNSNEGITERNKARKDAIDKVVGSTQSTEPGADAGTSDNLLDKNGGGVA